jgi:hypothetical protein
MNQAGIDFELAITVSFITLAPNSTTMNDMTNETGVYAPEQEIKDVFKTAPENKAWMQGEAFSINEIKNRLKAAGAEPVTPLTEVKKQIEQIKAFQTHGT